VATSPSVIGKYKVVSMIAHGGMGAVFKAVHPTLDRHVIIKKLTLRGDAAFAQRFKREASLMMDFKNEGIVTVYDHFREGSSYYIVMEFVDGHSVDELIKKGGRLPQDVALLILLDACQALKYAHDRNVVHRDIKPANILISTKGEVKLTDFGIAAVTDEEEEEGLTKDGATLGTPSYMAPEQFEDSKSVDVRADIYSLGVMLYEMVTGQKPFPGGFSAQSLALIQRGKYKPARKINPEVSRFVNRVIRKCMRVNPRRRFPDVGRVLKVVSPRLKKATASSLRSRLISITGGGEPEELEKAAPARTTTVFVAAGALLVLLGAAGYFLHESGLFYELLRPKEYGSLVVRARVGKGTGLSQGARAEAVVFQDEGGETPGPAVASMTLKPDKRRETPDHVILESRRTYLRSHAYRVRVRIENEVFWASFLLDAREPQKKDARTADGRVVQVALDSLPLRPLHLDFVAADAISGEYITQRTSGYVLLDSGWSRLGERFPEGMTTGKTYQIRFDSIGHQPEHYVLATGPYESHVRLQVSLLPDSGAVRITSDYDGIRLYLNGSQYYVSGDREHAYRKLAPSSQKGQEIRFTPGTYRLKAEYSTTVQQELAIDVKAGMTKEARVSFDRERKALTLSAER